MKQWFVSFAFTYKAYLDTDTINKCIENESESWGDIQKVSLLDLLPYSGDSLFLCNQDGTYLKLVD